uniref:Uncharacterized protein n=1 Tax=Davidia involucrata TaxID=16924 RepID=A0A5B6Z7Z1_DAVIN
MEQSLNPAKEKGSGGQKRKLPSAQELIAHYESQGLQTQEASIRVIEDLQNVLFRVVTTSGSGSGSGSGSSSKNQKLFMGETWSRRKLDVLNSRLLNLDRKIDSKPGYPETLAIGVASGALLRGFGALFPHVFGALGQMWNAVRNST